jgi:isopentenyl diphosphate isomerase/L-lactate dehydrogenase-like FMN-dependent dehydrogenase
LAVEIILAGELAPAVDGDLAVLGVQAHDDVAGKGGAGVLQEAGVLHRRADDQVLDAQIDVALDGVQITDAAAQLHRDLAIRLLSGCS